MAETFTLDQFADELDRLAAYHERGDHTRMLERVALPALRDGVASNFFHAASPDGSPWPPRRGNYSWPMLRKSLAMFNSLCTEAAPGGYSIVAEKFAVIGSEVRSPSGFNYPALHNYGGRVMPQREFAGLSPDAVDSLADAIANYLAEHLLWGA